jgi:7-keto-8-aminopelargonate synthetase-like enzyme
LNNLPQDSKIILNELRASFGRQLSVYAELRDMVRANLSKLILSRGDPGVLMAGVDKKVRLIDKINQERESVSGHIEFWQEYRKNLSDDRDAASLNDILTQTEAVIKEFLAEEEKLKQYVEKVFKIDGGAK